MLEEVLVVESTAGSLPTSPAVAVLTKQADTPMDPS